MMASLFIDMGELAVLLFGVKPALRKLRDSKGKLDDDCINPKGDDKPKGDDPESGPAVCKDLKSYFEDLPSVKPRDSRDLGPASGVIRVSNNKLKGVTIDEVYNYLVDDGNELVLAPRGHRNSGQKHTQLATPRGSGRGKAAGEMVFKDANNVTINSESGRYIRQSPDAINRVKQALECLGYSVKIQNGPFQ